MRKTSESKSKKRKPNSHCLKPTKKTKRQQAVFRVESKILAGVKVMVLAQSRKQTAVLQGNVRKNGGENYDAPGIALTHVIITPGISSKRVQEVLGELAAETLAVTPSWLADSIAKRSVQPGGDAKYAFGRRLGVCESATKFPKPEGQTAAAFVSFRNVYLNRMPGEIDSVQNKTFEDLIPESCDCALFTSLFPETSTAWLRSKCAGLVGKVLLIADRCPKLPTGSAGSGSILRQPDPHELPGWLVLEGQRASGILHCSLLLFRSKSMLRFVCAGTNLDGQMESDRDSMVVIDFPTNSSGGTGNGGSVGGRSSISSASSSSASSSSASPFASGSHFGSQLDGFLEYITSDLCYGGLPGDDLILVRERVRELLTGVHFSAADDSSCALVTCMPGGPSGRDKGGWLQMVDGLDMMGVHNLDGRLDIATGHFGALQYPFLNQMVWALRRETDTLAAAAPPAGDESTTGTVFCYHSSRKTVLADKANSFAVLRTTAPGWAREGANAELLSKYFHDSRAKFEREVGAADTLTPILHGKVMLATSADGERAACFVGSQNFSESSFGMNRAQPKNVEIGVLVKACAHAEVEGMRHRFPIHLAPADDFGKTASERGYVIARGPTDGNSKPGADGGLQGRWRARCNDLSSLGEWRAFLHGFWHICSECGATDVRPWAADIPAMERNAEQGVRFLCDRCLA
jgi:hypothetical protein